MKLFLLDVETTGLDKKFHDVVQIGGIISNNFKKITELNLKCQPIHWNTISKKALTINNLTREELKTFDKPKDVWEQFHKVVDENFNGEKYVFGGQNAPFDRRMLDHWWDTYKDNDTPDFDSYFEDSKYDIELMKITRLFKKQGLLDVDNVRLGTIVESLNIKIDGSLHDAYQDIQATGNCLYKLLKRIKGFEEQNTHPDIVSKFEDWLVLLEEPELTTK